MPLAPPKTTIASRALAAMFIVFKRTQVVPIMSSVYVLGHCILCIIIVAVLLHESHGHYICSHSATQSRHQCGMFALTEHRAMFCFHIT